MTGTAIFILNIILQLSQRKVVSKSESSENQQATALRNQVARMLMVNAVLFFSLHMPGSYISIESVKNVYVKIKCRNSH